MPRRPTKEESKNRYSSVTLPRDYCFFLDKLILAAAASEGVTETGRFLPSRRAVVQDAVEMYIEEIFPELHEEYVKMCKDAGMYQPLAVHRKWIVGQELLKAKAKERDAE